MEPEARPPRTPVRRVYDRFWGSDTAVMLTMAALVGIGAGLGAVLFIRGIAAAFDLFFVRGRHVLGFLGGYYVIVLPAIGGLLVGPLVHFLAPEAKGHGVPEVMTAMETRGGRIRPQVIAVKAVGSAITIGSGGSVGREGPIVQIGAAFGSVLGQRFHLSRRRILALVGSGAAAGIAATFNAPIAGVMFALEVLVGEYTVQAFSTMVFAAVSASVVSRFFLGDHPAFAVPSYSLVSSWELPLYLGLGIVGALAAALFVRFLYFMEDRFDGWRFPPYLKPAVGGLALGLVGYFWPQVFGTGFSTIERALNGTLALQLLVVLIFAKILATSLTLGSGASGGVFAPALFIGAVVGGAYGHLVHAAFPAVTATSGAYATVGMAVVFAAAARAPITAIVILFEMTLDYKIMLPLMVATVVATVVAAKMEPESIYTLKLVRRGIKFGAYRQPAAAASPTMGSLMRPVGVLPTVPLDATLADLARLFRNSGYAGVPVVDKNGALAGVVTWGDFERAVPTASDTATVADIYTAEVLTAHPDDRLDVVLARPGYLEVGRIPIVDPADPRRLLGLVRRPEILRAYALDAPDAPSASPQAGAPGAGTPANPSGEPRF